MTNHLSTHRWQEPTEVRRVATAALRRRGVVAADDVVDVLLETSLAGVHTHGIRLLAAFLDEVERGVADPAAEPVISGDTGPVVRLDARHALGVVAGLRAAGIAATRATRYGVGVVGVHHSNHFGAAGVYARRIAAAGHLGLVVTVAASRVAPSGGRQPLFGTNPIAVAFGDDFCLDMATSQVCFNEIKERRRTGQPLDDRWAVDGAGHGTRNPHQAVALAPLGGYKGQGLAMAVTVLTSVLVGGPLDTELEQIGVSRSGAGRGVTHLFLAVDPSALGGRDSAVQTMDRLLRQVRHAPPADPAQPVLVPGDPEHEHTTRQLREGLEIDAGTVALLDRLAAETATPTASATARHTGRQA